MDFADSTSEVPPSIVSAAKNSAANHLVEHSYVGPDTYPEFILYASSGPRCICGGWGECNEPALGSQISG